ncbi:MAG TPA: LacI family DNA-binding transcriptional regulator [Chitinophagaceae bacterium]|nr:LacI family DNA-binding transcriptional regulator [Chitinophagaceae bacterium]
MTNDKEITIYDIARELNISSATVSRALNDHPATNEKTRIKISELAKQMGYRQNNFAKNLRQKKTKTIGVIVHELNSQFITSVLSGIEKVAAESHYNLIIGHSNEKSTKEVANASNLFHKRVDGLIASLAFNTENLEHYDSFFQRGIPIVFFDRVKVDGGGIKVIIDNKKAGYEPTNHLIEQGCKKIMHVTGNLTKNVYSDRLQGFKDAITEHHLPLEPNWLVVNDLSEEAGIKTAQQILKMKDKPDGIFITNDLCAAVCMQHLKEGGIKIPEEMAVVGFNNDIISRIVEPKLTTVQYDGKEMGEVAARNLINHLNGVSKITSANTIILRSELIVRGSSKRKKV